MQRRSIWNCAQWEIWRAKYVSIGRNSSGWGHLADPNETYFASSCASSLLQHLSTYLSNYYSMVQSTKTITSQFVPLLCEHPMLCFAVIITFAQYQTLCHPLAFPIQAQVGLSILQRFVIFHEVPTVFRHSIFVQPTQNHDHRCGWPAIWTVNLCLYLQWL